jgi:hypothetical protein
MIPEVSASEPTSPFPQLRRAVSGFAVAKQRYQPHIGLGTHLSSAKYPWRFTNALGLLWFMSATHSSTPDLIAIPLVNVTFVPPWPRVSVLTILSTMGRMQPAPHGTPSLTWIFLDATERRSNSRFVITKTRPGGTVNAACVPSDMTRASTLLAP